MTNKLPVVGKRYKDKSGSVFKLKEHSLIRLDYPDWWTEFCFEEMKISCPLKYFFDNFEELPEDKAETKPETQSHISELSPEVKKAMEVLQKEIIATSFLVKYDMALKSLREAGIVLLDAIDKQFTSKESEKIDTKEPSVDSVNMKEGDLINNYKKLEQRVKKLEGK